VGDALAIMSVSRTTVKRPHVRTAVVANEYHSNITCGARNASGARWATEMD
jgi:hypothetical protein